LSNVIFRTGTLEQYKALLTKDANTLYWLEDVQQLWKGDKLYAAGLPATAELAGLMSSEDKAKLDSLGTGVIGLTSVDKSIVIRADEGATDIGVALSARPGNVLSLEEDGLYAPAMPEYAIERQASAESDFIASYKLKKTVGDEVTYVGVDDEDVLQAVFDLFKEQAGDEFDFEE